MNCPQCDCYCAPDAESCACGYRFPSAAPSPPSPYAKRQQAVLRLLAGVVPSTWTLRTVSKSWIFRIGTISCLALWGLALFFADRLPPQSEIFPQLYLEPLQTDADLPAAFQVTREKMVYIVTPLFRYELSGLVVSRHRSDSLMDISHRRWRDFLNIEDLCVVWGKNIQSGVYREMKFWNRDFTCNCSFPDEKTAARFSPSHLSNNHILCADENMGRRIRRVRPGDQVFFKGYLVTYSQPANQFFRGTSTVRDDTGDGACETVFVTEFKVLQRANPVWRAVKPVAFLGAAAFLVALLLA